MEPVRLKDASLRTSVGERIRIIGLLKKLEARPMRSGSNSITFIICDKDREMDIKWFDVSATEVSSYSTGSVYLFTVDVKRYEKGKDGLSLILYNSEVELTNMDSSDFKNWEDNLTWAFSELNRLMLYIGDCDIGLIANKIMKDNISLLSTHPAASSMHHNGMGGLAVHMAGVACGCEKLADYYTSIYGSDFIDKKLLICGALLHDIGKLKELSFDVNNGSTEYSTLGKLGTHIVYGIAIVESAATQLGLSGKQEVYELMHLIASHHGKSEYGSPIEPHCIEADILSRVDDLDALAYKRYKVCRDLDRGSGISDWGVGGLNVNYRALNNNTKPTI